MKELTWQQVWMYHDHAKAYEDGTEVDYDEPPPPLDMPGVKIENGARVYNR